jgi:transcription elongation factor GreA
MAILTKDGLDKFKKEQDDLIETRKGAVVSLSRARDMGDLSENGFYKAARHELSNIDRRLRELGYIIKGAEIIRKTNHGFVALGSQVKVLVNGVGASYEIVGKYEANPKQGKISNESPVGQTLLGKTVGEKFVLGVDVIYSYEVISIN